MKFDWDEFLGIEKEGKKKKKKEKKEWIYEELQKEVQKAGITSNKHYKKMSKLHKWPCYNTIRRRFPNIDWDDFLGREKKERWTYEELQKDVQKAKIKSSGHYEEVRKSHGWPTSATLRRRFPNIDWDDFLGREKKERWTYEELQKEVQKAGITTSIHYGEVRKSHGWPCYSVVLKYHNFDCDKFFGRKRWTYEELQKEVQKAGITTSIHYREVRKSHGWPTSDTIRKHTNLDWDSFLGR